jgi:hypothetical protein
VDYEEEQDYSQADSVLFIPVFSTLGVLTAIYLTVGEGGSFGDFVTGMMLLGACGYAADLLLWFTRKKGRHHGLRWHWTMAALAAAAIRGLFFSEGEDASDMLVEGFATAVLLFLPAFMLDAFTATIVRRIKRSSR